VPKAREDAPVAVLRVPEAFENAPVAVLLAPEVADAPVAVLKPPEAVADAPVAVLSKFEAVAPCPNAELSLPVAMLPSPIAVVCRMVPAALLVAVAPVPSAKHDPPPLSTTAVAPALTQSAGAARAGAARVSTAAASDPNSHPWRNLIVPFMIALPLSKSTKAAAGAGSRSKCSIFPRSPLLAPWSNPSATPEQAAIIQTATNTLSQPGVWIPELRVTFPRPHLMVRVPSCMSYGR
jgi:hypothetical protein